MNSGKEAAKSSRVYWESYVSRALKTRGVPQKDIAAALEVKRRGGKSGWEEG